MRGWLADVVRSGLTADQLLSMATPDAEFHSALSDCPELSREQAARLIAAETTGIEHAEITDSFDELGRAGLVIAGDVDGEPTFQILRATYEEGRLAELASFVQGMFPFTLLRDKVKAALTDLPTETWAVPELTEDTGEERTAGMTFPHDPELSFLSPVLRRPAAPQSEADKVLILASSIYGTRNWADSGLVQGDKRLACFQVDVSGRPLTIANLLTFTDDTVVEIRSASRPWSSALAMYARLESRYWDELGAEYFWAEQPDHDAYI
jgi:hypothetical protein